MAAIIAILLAGITSAALTIRLKRGFLAWVVGCCVFPVFVLLFEFVIPYQGGGASMWPIAMFFGGIFGAVSSGLGVLLASFAISESPDA